MERTFLTARWANLALLTYRVPAELLRPWLPRGCELDLWEGEAYVSLVAFDFLRTKVLGIGWPGLRNFPEINLRFYVRCGGVRGVCFVREYVPKRIVAEMARWIYNEPYQAARMESVTRQTDGEITVRHRLTVNGKEHTLELVAGKERRRPGPESVEHFFKEHQWGFGRRRNGELLRYEVNHPEWDVYAVRGVKMKWDWAGVYGEEWGFLEKAQPYNSMLAVGSEVTVLPKQWG